MSFLGIKMTSPRDRITEMKDALRGADIELAQLAQGAGVNVSTVWRWETGKTSPRFDDMQRLEDTFGNLMATVSEPPGVAKVAA